MKLRTVMRGFADGTYYAAVKAGDTADAINHDAAAAHALMQALADVDIEDFESFSSTCVTQIMERADALLKQWGFDTEEDA